MIKKLQWFNITYTNKKQANNLQEAIPLYVIKKVALATTVRKNDTVRAPKEFTAMYKAI
jgi:ribosomal protein L13E